MSKSLVKSPAFWLGVAGAAAISTGAAYYLRNKEEIDYYIRLYGVKREADKFYAAYPYLTKNIVYDPNLKPTLDVYRPESGSDYPVLIYVHGGSWNTGSKELYAPAAQRLLPHGLVVVAVGYTLYPRATYRQQTAEVAAAIAWTLENIAGYGGDPKRVVVCTQSAGSQLAGLALFDEQWLAPLGHSVDEIAGFIGISGVYDIVAQYEFGQLTGQDGNFLIRVMEGEANFWDASPVKYVRPGLPPALLIHGDADQTVPIFAADAFHDALIASGNHSRYLIYERGGHSEILFEALTDPRQRLVKDMAGFVKACAPV